MTKLKEKVKSRTTQPISRLTTQKLKKARALIGGGKLIPGLGILEEIIAIDVGGGCAWLDYADVLTDLHRFDEALRAYDRALEYAPASKQIFVYARIGIMLEQSGNMVDARRYYELALNTQARPDAWVQILYGNNLAKQGIHQEAEMVLREAARLESGEQDEAYLNLAILFRSTERYEEAREMAMKALQSNPRCAGAREVIDSL